MQTQHIELEKLGLSAPEAQIYLALLRQGGALGAVALATNTKISRSNTYLALNSLADRGLIEAEAGYGSRFSAVPAEQALSALIAHKNNELLDCKRRAAELVKNLQALTNPAPYNGEAELIQVLRDPRVIGERFERLQLEVERQVEVCVKAPFLLGSIANSAQEKALRRGVRGRGLYERAILDAPEVRPFLERWIAKGEEVRIYDGELPHKLALFDRKTVLLPLFMPGGPVRTLFIRHPQLAMSLGIMFDFLWEQAEPLRIARRPVGKKIAKPAKGARRQAKEKELLGSDSNG